MLISTPLSLKLQRAAQVEFLGAFVDNSRDSTGGTLCLLMAFCEGHRCFLSAPLSFSVDMWAFTVAPAMCGQEATYRTDCKRYARLAATSSGSLLRSLQTVFA